MDLNKEIIKGHIESIVLSLLKQESLYCYEISKKIRSFSNNAFEIKDGTLYVVLKRLESLGLVTSYVSNGKSGGGKRRYFSITVKGESYLKDKIDEWTFLKNIIDIFLRGEKYL